MMQKIAGRISAVVMVLLVMYAVSNIIRVRIQLARAEDYRCQLTEEIAVLAKENERLEEEIAQADDPQVIRAMATRRLGLVMPGERIFMVKEDSGKRKSGG